METIEVLLILVMFASPMFFTILIFYFIFSTLRNAFKRSITRSYFKENVITVSHDSQRLRRSLYKPLTNKEIEAYHINNVEAFKDMLFEIFKTFENAYNSLDYNMMKINSTSEIFNNYYTGISLDLKIGKKKVIEDVKRSSLIIYEMYSSNQKQIVSTVIEIAYKTYTLNKEGFVISGDRSRVISEKFEVIFRKNYEHEDLIKCPGCGATVTGTICEYCRTPIKLENYKISSIKKIVDN